MAVTPRTLLTQPAPAAVAAVSLFGFTISGLGLAEHAPRPAPPEPAAICGAVVDGLGSHTSWTQADWVRFTRCLQERGEHRLAVQAAADGLDGFPRSEALYNIKGYSELSMREYGAAVETLERAHVTAAGPRSATLQNNLAWAYLWVDRGHTTRARQLYVAALEREPHVCETLHTGLMVEYDTARHSTGLARADALKRFHSLSDRYRPCLNRDADWDTLVESVGAAFAQERVASILDVDAGEHSSALATAARRASQRFGEGSADVLCAEAMPMADLRAGCVRAVKSYSEHAHATR